MFYRFKKRLLHFTTNGNIAEDFIKARHGKVRELRRRIRVCFYIHCAAVVLCVGAAVLFGTLPEIIQAAVCAVASTVFALFAAGDYKYAGLIACVIDTAFTAGAVLLAVFTEKMTVYIVCGCLMLAALISVIVLAVFGSCKRFLLDYSPLSIRRDDYTLLNEVGYKLQTSVKHITPQRVIVETDSEEELPPLPPLTSEMRELAVKVREILLSAEKKQPPKTEKNDDYYSSNTQ